MYHFTIVDNKREQLIKMGVRHTRSFLVVVTVPIGWGWQMVGRVAVSLKLFLEKLGFGTSFSFLLVDGPWPVSLESSY